MATSTDNQVRPYDFRKPSRLPFDVEEQLLAWQGILSTMIQDKLVGQLPFATGWKPLPPETVRPHEIKDEQPNVSWYMEMAGCDLPSLLVIPRAAALGMVLSQLGEVPAEAPEDRELTALELSVVELPIQTIADAANDSELTFVRMNKFDANPRYILTYKKAADLVVLRYQLELPFGEFEIRWIWPQDAVLNLFSGGNRFTKLDTMEQLANDIPFELVIRLGEAKVDVGDLANLKVGDVIVLDQRVTDLLEAYIDQDLVFLGSPGRVGNRQAFQIETVTEE